MKSKIIYSGLLLCVTSLFSSEIPTSLELKQKYEVLNQNHITITNIQDRNQFYHLRLKLDISNKSYMKEAFIDKASSNLYIGNGYDSLGKTIVWNTKESVINQGIFFALGSIEKPKLFIVSNPQMDKLKELGKSGTLKKLIENFHVNIIIEPTEDKLSDWLFSVNSNQELTNKIETILMNKEYSIDSSKVNLKLKEKSFRAAMELSNGKDFAVFNSSFKEIPENVLGRLKP